MKCWKKINYLKCNFYSKSCVLQELIYDEVIATQSLVGNLYILNIKNKLASTCYSTKVSSTISEAITNTLLPSSTFIGQLQSSNAKLWHQRMVHALINLIQKIPCIPFVFSQIDVEPYTICHLSKQQRLHFPRSNVVTFNIFYVVHIDIWDSYSQFPIFGAPYFIARIDDKSRAT